MLPTGEIRNYFAASKSVSVTIRMLSLARGDRTLNFWLVAIPV
jgi:hypothetical protein